MPIINLVYEAPEQWKPWANTIAYYPLNWDANDYSWNSRNLTNNGVTFNTSLASWQKVAYFSWSSTNLSLIGQNISTSAITLSMWLNKSRNSNEEIFMEILGANVNDFIIQSTNSNIGNMWLSWWIDSNNNSSLWYNNTGISNWTRRHIVAVLDSNWCRLYQNWQKLSLTYSRWSESLALWTRAFTQFYLWWRSWVFWQWYISEAIYENKARTAQEISDYYNQTKANYGL